ncbi:hypothetical protein BV20DRAFT_397172 [Pilatotrama ljubarskyi]|nr:hypothetical protein BV20DRAFT_397172 [Pilatotrama ljubarskyi]
MLASRTLQLAQRLEKLKCRTDNHEVPAVEALNCKLCHGSRCFRCLLEQGTHSAEAIYEYQRSAPSCIRWHKRHVANLDNLKTFRTDQKLFNLDDASTMKERLRIAASSFPKCRPGHAKVKLGFYDCENEGGDLFAEEIEDAVPPETDIVKPDMFVMTEEMSPLTPDEDSSMDSILGDPPSKDADISISAAQPPLSLSSNTVVDEDEVISITSSSSSSSSSHPGPATTGPEITVPRNDVTVATGDNPIPKAEVYVWLPPKPHYAVIVKRASSPSRDVVASRKKPRSVSLRDAEGSSHGRDRNARVGQLPRAHSAQVDDSVDSDRDGVASNMAAEGLVRSLSMANGAPPIFTQSSPKAKRPIVSAHRRKMVIESDSETASPPAEQDTVALTSASVAQPPRPRPEHPRRSSLSNTSLKEPAASSSVAPSPQLPRTYALKRARLEESVEVGKTAQQTSNSSAAPGTAPSSVSGRAPKKRKGPPGYTAEEVEKMKAAEVAEQFARRERKIQSGKLTVRTQVPRESTVPVPRDADTMRPPTAPNARNASAPVNTTRTETRDAAPASVHASTSSIADGVSFSATSGPLHPVVALSPRAPIPPPIPLSGNAENESPVRPSGSLHQLLIATQDIAQRWAAFEESLRYMVEIEEKSRTDRQYWEEQFASLRKMLEDRDKEAKRVLEEKDKSINKLQEEVQGLNKEMRIIKEELHARAKELRSLQDAHEKVRQQQEVSNLAIVKNQTDIITLFNISATHDLQQQIRDIALEVVRSAQTQIRCTQHAPAEVPPPADIRPSQPLPTAMPQHTSRQDNWRGQQGPNPDARGLVNGSTRGAADHLPPRGSFGEWYPAQDQSEQRRSRRWDHRGGQRGLEQSDQHRRGGSHYHDTWGASSNGDSWDDRGSREYHPRGGDYRRRSGSRSRSPRRAQSSRPPPTGPRAEREASVVSDKSDKQRTVSVKADTPPSTIELFPSSASSSGKPNPSYSSIQESSFTEGAIFPAQPG